MSPYNSFAPPILPSTVAIPPLAAVINKKVSATDIALAREEISLG